MLSRSATGAPRLQSRFLVVYALILALAAMPTFDGRPGAQASPLPMPLQKISVGPLYLEGSNGQAGPRRRQIWRLSILERTLSKDVQYHEVDELDDLPRTRHRHRRTRLAERQILPLAPSHPLTFIPGLFTRDAAAAACGAGNQLAAVDVSFDV